MTEWAQQTFEFQGLGKRKVTAWSDTGAPACGVPNPSLLAPTLAGFILRWPRAGDRGLIDPAAHARGGVRGVAISVRGE